MQHQRRFFAVHSSSFDAIFFLEVLEHLPYSPAHPFREMHRVLKPGGRLYLTTPNAASLSRVRLLLLGKNHEPSVDAFVDEGDPFSYKGMTFFKSQREARLWTVEAKGFAACMGLPPGRRLFLQFGRL